MKSNWIILYDPKLSKNIAVIVHDPNNSRLLHYSPNLELKEAIEIASEQNFKSIAKKKIKDVTIFSEQEIDKSNPNYSLRIARIFIPPYRISNKGYTHKPIEDTLQYLCQYLTF